MSGEWSRFALKDGDRCVENPYMAAPTMPVRARRTAVAAALVLALSLLAACLSPAQEQVLKELNNDRIALRLRSLNTHDEAQAKAQAWAEKLARENKLYHSKLTDGIRSRWCSIGENVGYGPSVAAVQDAYMASAGHRANIVATKWNGVGVGHATNGNRVYTVQVFIQSC